MVLEGKTALITGGSRGIGRAISELYYQEGATLIIMARNEQKLKEACAQIDKEHQGRVYPIACDVGNKDSIAAAFEQIKAQGLTIDILVNCAGINIREPLETFSLESWNKVMDVNLTGAFLITQACSLNAFLFCMIWLTTSNNKVRVPCLSRPQKAKAMSTCTLLSR